MLSKLWMRKKILGSLVANLRNCFCPRFAYVAGHRVPSAFRFLHTVPAGLDVVRNLGRFLVDRNTKGLQ
jgi:hypothetical protein